MKESLKEIQTTAFDYSLPDDRIAKYPLHERDQSKLLVYNNKNIQQDSFCNLAEYLPRNSHIILNNTRVIHARLIFRKTSGSKIEVFLIEPHAPQDYVVSFSKTRSVIWKCIIGNLKKWKDDTLEIRIPSLDTSLKAVKKSATNVEVVVEFQWDKDLSFAQVVELCGEVPLPPYLNRAPEKNDSITYQTVYANKNGSVAAPTAGLHFTQRVFDSLSKKNIDTSYITLHVGAGTFKPVKTNLAIEHEMHAEHFFVDLKVLKRLYMQKGNRIVVGTTTLRTLESIYWLGVKALRNELNESNFISQWEVYNLSDEIEVNVALEALISHMVCKKSEVLEAQTQLMILPGYKIRMANSLITNYHQPKSTLLFLVAAFMGEEWKKAYSYALENGFRFLSYGDSMLIINDLK